ncbi:hypothetical protein [Nocardia panacis]|uniref:hypothetical protein n=1 Tax=Nocardia panacis TaxID=2340916 RepID=UPI0011C353AD|nr:hypothetical protein [Nocardia panacis]
MSRSESIIDRLHLAMHRLPGMPDHERAPDRNSNRAGRVRALRWNSAGRDRAARWNHTVNESACVRAARWNSNAVAERVHARPPRVLVGWQTWIGDRLGRGR